GHNSTDQDADLIAKKIANAILFEYYNNKLNFNIQQMNCEILSVSQFTLYADVKKGNRPGFSNSKNPDQSVKIYEYFNDALRAYGLTVKTGEFVTHINVIINNDGPVTIIY
ncbi:D-aminoacyl-tRNA deacylase, partial [Staphylococcus aureus]|uniref:D-aminoacyl-tRNA deacylase n=1 Tax=Staphylococcus aureus TaxID=1280 RepID=UPI00210E497F